MVSYASFLRTNRELMSLSTETKSTSQCDYEYLKEQLPVYISMLALLLTLRVKKETGDSLKMLAAVSTKRI